MPQQETNSSDSVIEHLVNLIRHPQETLILCIVSALDVIMTRHLLIRNDVRFTESNPVARYFIDRWGLDGMAYFKGAMTLFVCVITQIVARKNPDLAKHVLELATVIVIGVVIYSVWLHFNHRQVVEVIQESFFPALNQFRLVAGAAEATSTESNCT